jgi:hydrogenase nickel incorporation protein HypB
MTSRSVEADNSSIGAVPAAHRVLAVRRNVLEKNEQGAARNRDLFGRHGVTVINVLSAPGSGKTSLLERTLTDLSGRLRGAVIVGDLATDQDARRLARSGAPVVQLTTGTVCHLEADMVGHGCRELDLTGLDLLFVENVGNLVCPAAFDLGESCRVVLTAVTEGEDKPLKYPSLFKTADVVVITKVELAAAAGFERDTALRNIMQIAPQAVVLELSSRTGQGLPQWYAALEKRLYERRGL